MAEPLRRPDAAPLAPPPAFERRPALFADHLAAEPLIPPRSWRWWARELLTLIFVASVAGSFALAVWSTGR